MFMLTSEVTKNFSMPINHEQDDHHLDKIQNLSGKKHDCQSNRATGGYGQDMHTSLKHAPRTGYEHSAHTDYNPGPKACPKTDTQSGYDRGPKACPEHVAQSGYEHKAIAVQSHGMRNYLMFALSLLVCMFVMYQSISAVMADEALDDLLAISGKDYQLSAEDRQILSALNKANNPKSSKARVSRPQVNDATGVRFIYGASRPRLVCSLLHVCDIALEPNENVVDVKAGDSARWIIERSASGSPQGMIEHIAVKPTDIGLQSNLRIYTDKRTYYIELSSSEKDFMPQISFIYPEQALHNLAQIKSDLQKSLQSRTISSDSEQSAVLIDNLDFNYQYSGDDNLYPIRSYNDGKKTYLQMPPKIMSSRLPALVVVNSTSFIGEDETAVTNYRIKGDKYIIDGIPERIRLILSNQDNGSSKSADIIHHS